MDIGQRGHVGERRCRGFVVLEGGLIGLRHLMWKVQVWGWDGVIGGGRMKCGGCTHMLIVDWNIGG